MILLLLSIKAYLYWDDCVDTHLIDWDNLSIVTSGRGEAVSTHVSMLTTVTIDNILTLVVSGGFGFSSQVTRRTTIVICSRIASNS